MKKVKSLITIFMAFAMTFTSITAFAKEPAQTKTEVIGGSSTITNNGNTFNINLAENEKLWRMVAYDDSFNRIDSVNGYDDEFVLEVNDNVSLVRAYVTDSETYDEILSIIGDRDKSMFWDNPEHILKYHDKTLSKDEFNEVYGEQLNIRKQSPDYNSFNVDVNELGKAVRQYKANSQPAKKMLKAAALPSGYIPSVGDVFGGDAWASENNAYTLNDFVVTFTSGFLEGETINVWCAQQGEAAPVGSCGYECTITEAGDGYAYGEIVISPDLYSQQDCYGEIYMTYEKPNGYLALKKVSADTSVTDNNSNYSLNGAVYSVYSNSDLTGFVGQLITNSSGTANTLTLAPGTYYVVETTAPKNYIKDTKVYPVTVVSNQTAYVNGGSVKDTPVTGKVQLRKTSANPSITDGNNCYSLEGAVYGIYEDAACTKLYKTLTTDKNGVSDAVDVKLGTFYVKEIKAPKGYLLDTNKVYQITLNVNNLTATINAEDIPLEDPIDICLKKVDADTGEEIPLGAGTLQGAVFEYKYYDNFDASGEPKAVWHFVTDENGVIKFNPDYLDNDYINDEMHQNKGENYFVPLGSITIQEINAPTGYLVDDSIYKYKIDETILGITLDINVCPTVKEQVVRGDYSFTKMGSDNKPVADCKFKVTSLDTEESHYICTDENGFWSSDMVAHSVNTNEGNADSGLWFGEDADGNLSIPNDKLGAFPYGTYRFEEIRCEGNIGYDLTSWEVEIIENGVVVAGGVITDNKIGITTTATVNNEKFTTDIGKVTIKDVCKMTNLTVGEEYTLKGVEMIKETGEPLLVNGKEVIAETTFTADKPDMEITLEYVIDTTDLGNVHLVTFEYLYNTELNMIAAKDADINNTDQTVTVKTTGSDSDKGKMGDGTVLSGEFNTPKTGDMTGFGIILIILMLVSAVAIAFDFKNNK